MYDSWITGTITHVGHAERASQMKWKTLVSQVGRWGDGSALYKDDENVNLPKHQKKAQIRMDRKLSGQFDDKDK